MTAHPLEPVPTPACNDAVGPEADQTAFLDGPLASLAALGGLVCIGLIALLDHGTGSRFSFSLFYILPVAACAWWGGLPCGVLLALAGAAAWHTVDASRGPVHPVILLWNGVVRFGILTLVSSLVSRLRVGITRERALARTDSLTGAANGRTFYAVAEAEADRADRYRLPLTLVYFDLDNFKQLNDRLGHAIGDAALRRVAQTVRANLRATDLLARLGGDEFAILLPDTGAEGAGALLARVRDRVAAEMAAHGWPISLSVGAVTFMRPPADVDLMLRRVDALMYGAKRKGKGRLEHEVEGGHSGKEWIGTERRATARVMGACPARVRPADRQEAEAFATVRDISATGIGLTLEVPVTEGTLLLVEPFAAGVRALMARVVRVAAEPGGWRHGCELSTRLSDEEVTRWMGTPAVRATPVSESVEPTGEVEALGTSPA